ncbi:MAG: triose-phosphate isomerase, partial [Burkholderiaceae bacterium]|nr:triose-phosphate isomerase [Burkholderiaceae bacterium]
MRTPLVAANWKMNGQLGANAAWLAQFRAAAAPRCDVVVCAPFVYLPQLVDGLAGSRAVVGAQNLSHEASGAFTGEVAGEMLVDIGCPWVIVGHSERRALYGETDALVADKAARAIALGLKPIVCVGETLQE